MATAFTRTFRRLQADRPGRSLGGILLAAAMLGGWVAWSAAARITLYEITGSARLEVDRAAYAVQAPIQAKVVETRLPSGARGCRGRCARAAGRRRREATAWAKAC